MTRRGRGPVGESNGECTRRAVLRAGAVAALGGTAAVGTAAGDERVGYLVVGRPRFDDLSDRIAREGFSVRGTFAGGSLLLVSGGPGRERRLGAIRGVVDAVRDRPIRGRLPRTPRSGTPAGTGGESTDSRVGRQWDKAVTAGFEAHETATGDGATIAVIDSGIDAAHPDLEGNLNQDGSRRASEGRLHPSRGRDGLGHGTFVAGVAAAAGGDEGGIVGMAPDAELVSVSPSFGATALVDVVASMEYAVAIGADVMNLSLGLLVDLSPRIERALRRLVDRFARFAYPQTVTVIASGNRGIDASPGTGVYDFPASIENAITVGATGPNDARTYYSTYGSGFVDVGAPGGGYESAGKSFCEADDDGDDTGRISAERVPGAAGDPCELPEYPYPTNHIYGPIPPASRIARVAGYAGERYAYLGGTSFAAPQVAGVVALVREVAPSLPAQRVERLVAGTADPVRGERPAELGAGRVNAARAVAAARESS